MDEDVFGNTVESKEKTKITCDQVAWINSIFDRFADLIILADRYPSISRLKQVAKGTAIVELMEILHLDFDDSAFFNAIWPIEIREAVRRKETRDAPKE